MNINRILNKTSWTGRELGILEVTNMCRLYKQALAGEPQTPIVDVDRFRAMRSTLDDLQREAYYGYIAIHEFLLIRFNAAQTQLQQTQLHYKLYTTALSEAIVAEDTRDYLRKLPAIMTQAQYERLRAKRIEEELTDMNGDDYYYCPYDAIEEAVFLLFRQLHENPAADNPLKAIRQQYETQPIKSKYIWSRWGEVFGENQHLQKSDEPDPETGEYYPVYVDYPETPSGCTKWEFIENGYLREFYDIEPREADKAREAYEDLAAEFSELVTAIIQGMETRYFAGDPLISSLPASEWGKPLISARKLYELNVYGKRDYLNSDTVILAGNWRAMVNGVAIIKLGGMLSFGENPYIDADGNYQEPEIEQDTGGVTFDSLIPSHPDYEFTAGYVTDARRTLLRGYYYLTGYNRILDLIADYYKLPDVDVFKMETEDLAERIAAYNEVLPVQRAKMEAMRYEHKHEQLDKLKALDTFFTPIDTDALTKRTPESVREVKKLFKDFEAFKRNTSGEELFAILCKYRDPAGEGGTPTE